MAAASSTIASLVLVDLQGIFGNRLEAFVTYAPSVSPQPSLALVQSLDLADLVSCAARVILSIGASAAKHSVFRAVEKLRRYALGR